MKIFKLLFIGLIILLIGCTEDLSDSSLVNDEITKSAQTEKTVTHKINGTVTAIGNLDLMPIACMPEELGIALPGGGWCEGHASMIGKFVKEESTFERVFCSFSITDEGPVVYSESSVVITGMRGDKKFLANYSWINLAQNTVTGYNSITGGTGRFEGAFGTSTMENGIFDPVTGNATWIEEGTITLIIGKQNKDY